MMLLSSIETLKLAKLLVEKRYKLLRLPLNNSHYMKGRHFILESQRR